MRHHPPSFDDVAAAAARLSGIAHRTPVLTSASVDAALGVQVFFKCENLQRVGAFKFRGAYNALAQLDAGARARGVLAYSSGNHAQAVALAARLLGCAATIVMPADAPAVKRRGTEGYGARVIDYDPRTERREDVAARLLAQSEAALIPPFDHPHIIAGQGSAAFELFEQVAGLDALLVPCGGGGLLSGCALAASGAAPDCRVIGVEPEGAADAVASFRSGRLQRLETPQTIADGVRTPSLGELTFALIRQLAADLVSVPEASIAAAMYTLYERLKLVVEPSGALGLAALQSGVAAASARRIGVLISGGNVDAETFCRLLRAAAPARR